MSKKFIFCRDFKHKKYKVATDQLVFRPSVYGIIFRGKSILLSRQWDGYDFPGGGINRDERIEDALKREVWEETGIKIRPGKLITVCDDFFISIESKRTLHSILIYYLCKNPKGKITTEHLEDYEKKFMSAAEWIPLKDIKKIKFYNGVDSLKLIKEAYKVYTNG